MPVYETDPSSVERTGVGVRVNWPVTSTLGFVFTAVAFLFYVSGCGVQDSGTQRDDTPQYDSLTAAVADAMSLEDPLARAARLATALQGFDREALGEVLEAWILVADGIDGSQTVELALLINWWARYDPEGAFTWLHERRRQGNPVLLTALVRSWATREPIATRRAIDALARRREQDLTQVVRALVQGWNASGTPGVEAYLIALPSDTNRQVALTALAIDKVRRDGVEETIRWAEALSGDAAGDFKQLAFRRVAAAIAGVDPIRAAAWAESQRDGKWGAGLARSVSQKWCEQDGRSAMEWLRGLPDPDSADVARAFEEGYRTWLSTDGEAARAWLREQELDASLDPVVAIHARSTAREDPEAAIPWAARIDDDVRRNETLEKIAQAWIHRDPDAARAWMEKGELSDLAVQRVHASLERAKARAKKQAAKKRAGARK
jgi:hypothetical protein